MIILFEISNQFLKYFLKLIFFLSNEKLFIFYNLTQNFV